MDLSLVQDGAIRDDARDERREGFVDGLTVYE
jgi:hypothetical protein